MRHFERASQRLGEGKLATGGHQSERRSERGRGVSNGGQFAVRHIASPPMTGRFLLHRERAPSGVVCAEPRPAPGSGAKKGPARPRGAARHLAPIPGGIGLWRRFPGCGSAFPEGDHLWFARPKAPNRGRWMGRRRAARRGATRPGPLGFSSHISNFWARQGPPDRPRTIRFRKDQESSTKYPFDAACSFTLASAATVRSRSATVAHSISFPSGVSG